MSPRALLCDLDDTLIAFSTVAEPAWRAACAEGGPRLGLEPDELHARIRAAAEAFWSDDARASRARLDLVGSRRCIVADALAAAGVEDEAEANRLADDYSARRDGAVHALPHARDTLQALRARGISTALLTNGAGGAQRAKIERFALGELFDETLIEGELGFGKPDRRVFERALAALGVDAAEAWMVGDDLRADIAGAQALGIRAVWRDVRRAGLPLGSTTRPDAIIHEFHELPALLDGGASG